MRLIHCVFLPGLGASLLCGGIAFAQDNTTGTQTETLSTISIEGSRTVQSPTSPIEGYVAERSAGATKTDTPLVETPQSVSVISADQIEAQQARDIRSVLRYVGGVVPEVRGNVASRYDQIRLRGYQPDQYLDGLKLSGYYYTIPQIDPYLLERVEVIKGPASVLYGQTPPGGVINLVTKRPTEEAHNEAYVQVGNDSRVGLGFDIGGKLDEQDDVRYRVVATGNRRNGPQETVESENFSIAPSVTIDISDATELTLLASYRADPESGSYGALPYEGTVVPLPNGGKLDRDFYDGDTNFESFDRKQALLGYELSHWFNDNLQFRQNLRFADVEVDYRSVYGRGLTNGGTELARGTAASRESVNTLSIDNQLLAHAETGVLKHTILAGTDYQNLDGDRASGFGGAGNLSLANPDYSTPIDDPARTFYDFDQDQLGFYLQDQVKLGQLTLIGGGRYDTIQTSQTEFGANRETRKDRAFSGRVGAIYNFDNGLAPYVAYTESFQAPSTDSVSATILDPTEGEQYEAGIKFQPKGTNALITTSVFQLTQTNVAGPTQPDGSRSQTGEVEVQGAEVEAKASLASGLDLSAAVTYLDSEITRDETGNQGNEYPMTPDYTASMWLDYTQPSGAWKGAGGGVGVRYVGEQQVSNANERQVPDYTVADASLHYELGGLNPKYDGWRVGLNMQNVFNKKYVSSCINPNFCYYGYGRETTATVSYRWQ
ncbi:iron complex outermembrane recepter protein [Salinisphaera sp. T5B8]